MNEVSSPTAPKPSLEEVGQSHGASSARRMTSRSRPARLRTWLLCVCALGLALTAGAQFGGGRRRARAGAGTGPVARGNVPTWPVQEEFAQDVFTFARLRYPSTYERESLAWFTDYPDADLNLSYRLHQVTALRVNPEPKLLEIGDPELFEYPWLFMSGVGNIILTDPEAAILRRYLLNGGFILVDDFWGQTEWDGFYRALKQILPEHEPVDLPRSHPIFHWVFDLPDTLSLQTCNIRAAIAGKETGVTWEDFHAGGNTREVHFRAVYDERGRMLMMICHNTDNGDGWEEESSDPWFFREFSEKKNYPLAINLLLYVMSH